MPSTYTHYIYGQEVVEELKKDISAESLLNVIQNNIDLFNIGVHGPDLLFYYKALTKNEIVSKGHHMHNEPAMQFFKDMKGKVKSDAHMAYLLGFVCHLALDCECHTYIEYRIITQNVKHVEIEGSFDKYLLADNKIDYKTYNTAQHIVPNEDYAKVISELLDVDQNIIKRALKSLLFNSKLIMPNKLKDSLIKLVFKICGTYDDMCGMLLSEPQHSSCPESDRVLYDMYKKAIPLGVEMVKNFDRYIAEGEELCEEFNLTYGVDAEKMKILEADSQ